MSPRTVLRKKRGKGSTSSSAKKQKKKLWDLTRVEWDSTDVMGFLEHGWEPFGVAEETTYYRQVKNRSSTFIYLRKKASK